MFFRALISYVRKSFSNFFWHQISYTLIMLNMIRDETLGDWVREVPCIYDKEKQGSKNNWKCKFFLLQNAVSESGTVWDNYHIQRGDPNNSWNSRSVWKTVYLKHLLLFKAYFIRDRLLIKLVNFYSPLKT